MAETWEQREGLKEAPGEAQWETSWTDVEGKESAIRKGGRETRMKKIVGSERQAAEDLPRNQDRVR